VAGESACPREYGTFEYGTGVVYGSTTCFTAEALFVDIDTPARDLVQIVTSEEFTIDSGYLNPDNYIIIDTTDGKRLNVREVLRPVDDVTSNRLLLVLDKHVSGREYSITLQNLRLRTGPVLSSAVTGSFFARDAKANSMLSAIPDHYNTDPRLSTLRLILQALSESDDRIGSL
jgi:hypothetical protein